jgi:hypothetical protein
LPPDKSHFSPSVSSASTTDKSFTPSLATVKCAGIPIQAIFDSGASISIVSQKLFDKITKIIKPPAINPPRGPIAVASNTGSLLPTGNVNLPISLKNVTAVAEFAIVPNFKYEMLLGTNALKSIPADLLFTSNEIKLPDGDTMPMSCSLSGRI